MACSVFKVLLRTFLDIGQLKMSNVQTLDCNKPCKALQDQIFGTAALRQTQQTVGKCLTRA